jgi:hypothetical protein
LGDHSVSISGTCHKELERICKELGSRYQPFVEAAIYDRIHRKNPTTMTEIGVTYSKFKEIKEIQNMIVELTKFVNFFGSYSEQNRADMEAAIGNPSREDKELIEEVFDSGKYAAKEVRPLLKNLLKKLKEIRAEDRLRKAREKIKRQGIRRR